MFKQRERILHSTSSVTSSRNVSVSLAAILLAGLFFRLYHLGGESLWFDEAFSIKFAQLSLSQILFLTDNSPPLYYIILHWWIRVFGISEFSVRFPSAVFGFVSLFIMYKIGRKLFDTDVAKLSSLLLAFSVFHIEYSQEARTYSLSVLLTLLSMYFFTQLLAKVSYKVVIGYVVSSILLMYSHVYGLFIIIAQNIVFVLLYFLAKESQKLNFKRWAAAQCLLIILFLPWVGIFVNQIGFVQKGFWIEPAHISSIVNSLIYYSGSRELLLIFVMFSGFALISYENVGGRVERRRFFQSLDGYVWRIHLSGSDKVCFLLVWLGTPIILPFIMSRFSQPIYFTKYTIIASLALYLLVAKGITNIHNKYFKSATIIIIVTLSLIPIWQYYTDIRKEEWREVAKYIDTYARKEDLILFNAPSCMVAFNYYSRGTCLNKKGFPEIPAPRHLWWAGQISRVDEENIDALPKTAGQHDRVWVILSHSGDKKQLITKRLLNYFGLWYYKEYKDIRLYLFDKRHTGAEFELSGYKP